MLGVPAAGLAVVGQALRRRAWCMWRRPCERAVGVAAWCWGWAAPGPRCSHPLPRRPGREEASQQHAASCSSHLDNEGINGFINKFYTSMATDGEIFLTSPHLPAGLVAYKMTGLDTNECLPALDN
jgi:hypothetical protein